MKALFAILLIGVLCATGAAANEYANIHVVGVISAIGDHISMTKTGITVLGNGGYKFPTSDWGIDAMVTRQIADALAPRFTVRKIEADVSEIREPDDRTEEMSGFIRHALPPAGDIDAYVIVYKYRCLQACGATPFRLFGLGFSHHQPLLGLTNDKLYAFYRVAVVDARTLRTIDVGTAEFQTRWGPASPYGDIASSAWEDEIENLTPEQQDAIKAAMMPMVQKSLSGALVNAHLVPPRE
ncbi:MAG TPA: hypothetical protein VHL34_23710 [Rhizomicrobium sp.]|nr:hypothetical protein [Rhizomicrobium sp.]